MAEYRKTVVERELSITYGVVLKPGLTDENNVDVV